MPAASPIYGWRVPSLGDSADGPDGFMDLAQDVESTIANKSLTSYTPAFNSLGSVQPSNIASRTGQYAVRNGWCDVAIGLVFGGTTNGGTGQLYLTLPLTPSAAMPSQLFQCVLYVPGIGWWVGQANANSNNQRVYPFFPVQRDHVITFPWQNANEGNATGTGVPKIDGGWAIGSGGSFNLTGRYYVG